MKILVCVKQVPRLDQVTFQPGLNRIVREGVDSEVNPLDLLALGHGLALRDKHGGEVIAVTMGPPDARDALTYALRCGADRAVHLVDICFAGADTLATARTLARLVYRERPDVVLLGRSTIDGATAQVGPQLAELAGLAQVTHATALHVAGASLEVTREAEEGAERWRSPLPAIVTVEDGPEPHPLGDVATGAVEQLDAEALGGDVAGYGIRGSATYVQRVVSISGDRARGTTSDAGELARRIVELAAGAVPATAAAEGGGARELWVVAEPYRDGLHPVTAEALAAAHVVAGRLNARVVALLLGSAQSTLPAELAAAGAQRVMVTLDDALGGDAPEAYAGALAALVQKRSPFAVIGGWTTRGRDVLPRTAARLALGMTGDVVGIDVDPHPGDETTLDLVWLKPAWAGTVLARVVARTVPSFGTLRPGAVTPLARRSRAGVEVEDIAAEVAAGPGARRLARPGDGAALTGHGLLDASPVVLLVGARLDPAVRPAAVRLARQRGWALAGTSEAVGMGLVPRWAELSPRKRSLSPRLVVGFGLAAAADLDAVRGAHTLVAVDGALPRDVAGAADLAGTVPPADVIIAALDLSLGGDTADQRHAPGMPRQSERSA